MKLRKVLYIFLIFIISFQNSIVFADDEVEEKDEDIIAEIENEETNKTSAIDLNEPKTYSKNIICIERTTGEILYEKAAYERVAMASTTKILTCIIAIEKVDFKEKVEISSKAANIGGSTLGITSGITMTMESLLYGLMLRSGNDCAIAVAEYIGGSLEGFAGIMNEKAKSLGMVNSHFVSPHGLDNDNHYTTAYDLSLLTNYALKNESFRRIVGTKEANIMVGDSSRQIYNTNELLGNVKGVYGVKTGFTCNAGRCLVTACKRGNLDLIVVVLGADTKKIRGIDTKSVIDYVFNNFEMVDTYEIIKEAFENFNMNVCIKARKSLSNVEVYLSNKENYIYPINKNKIKDLKTSIYTVTEIDANTTEGVKLGILRLQCRDKILYSLDIVLNNKIQNMMWLDYMIIFLRDYKNYFKLYV